jgi:hypothetical protein
VSLLGKLLGRSTPPEPTLDQLFALTDAALTLEAALDLRPTGLGTVAYRAAEGRASSDVTTDAEALVESGGGPDVERSVDEFGFTWLLLRHDPADTPGLVTDLHAVNSDLVAAGFGPTLLCSLVALDDGAGHRVGLVYLYKRGTFYPFAPTGAQTRDTAYELQVRAAVGSDLPVEPDVSRWFPVWGAPGLTP